MQYNILGEGMIDDRCVTDGFGIVRLTSADVNRLHAFYVSLEPEVVRFYEPYGPTPTAEKMREVLASVDAGKDVAFAAEDAEGVVVGHVFISDLAGEKPTFGIGLATRAHGRGLGRRLAETVLAEADAAGVPTVMLTVVKQNIRAHTLYQSLGFEDVGEETFRSANDSYVMRRRRFAGIVK
jgi:RimJ/RimL family protein N-acetyltransferase